MKLKGVRLSRKLLKSLVAAEVVAISMTPFVVSAGSVETMKEISQNMYMYYDEDMYPTYVRYDGSTGEYHNISIFDDENISSYQYGANQIDFEKKYKKLIQDPLIFEELQRYFPIGEFSSEEEAYFFYQKYFQLIADCGCGFAVVTDAVFHAYEGYEKEFEQTFGYPMYMVTEDGKVDFNYELFMLKFFDYSTLDMEFSKEAIMGTMMKDLYNFQLNEYIHSEEYNRKLPDDFASWTEDEWAAWNQFDDMRNQKFHELYDKWSQATNQSLELGVTLDADFGYLSNYLRNYGISISTNFYNGVGNYITGDILASDSFDLYVMKDDITPSSKLNDVGCHYVYVTDTKNGNTFVSSWGRRYVFDDEDANWTTVVKIKK